MMEPSLFAAKIFDDNTRINSYSEQLLDLIKKQFRTRSIDKYDYERFINLLTCLKLQTEESRKDINDFIKQNYNYTSSIIDLKI